MNLDGVETAVNVGTGLGMVLSEGLPYEEHGAKARAKGRAIGGRQVLTGNHEAFLHWGEMGNAL